MKTSSSLTVLLHGLVQRQGKATVSGGLGVRSWDLFLIGVYVLSTRGFQCTFCPSWITAHRCPWLSYHFSVCRGCLLFVLLQNKDYIYIYYVSSFGWVLILHPMKPKRSTLKCFNILFITHKYTFKNKSVLSLVEC